jgi:hypothetical protein
MGKLKQTNSMSKPHEKTGQTTEQGKQINSRNAAKLRQIFIDEAARALRELARANCEFDKSEQELYSQQPDKLEWDIPQQAEFERKLRNRSTAQRAYSRRLRAVEYLDKLQLQAQQRVFREKLQNEKIALSRQHLRLAATRMEKVSKPNI